MSCRHSAQNEWLLRKKIQQETITSRRYRSVRDSKRWVTFMHTYVPRLTFTFKSVIRVLLPYNEEHILYVSNKDKSTIFAQTFDKAILAQFNGS